MTVDIAPTPTCAAAVKPPRERLIEAASELFCRFGINAVGVDAVVAKAGTAKATLYKLFGSKEHLVELVLEREGRAWRNWFLSGLETGGATAGERLRCIFPLLEQWFSQENFYGCPFINAIAEHDKRNDRLRAIAMTHKKAVLSRLEELASEAGSPRPNHFAHQIGIIIDGAIVAAMITRDPSVALLAADAAEPLFGELSGARGRKRRRGGRGSVHADRAGTGPL